MLEALEREGFVVLEGVISMDRVHELRKVFDNSSHGIRNILRLPEVAALLQSDPMRAIVGTQVFAVRGIYFDKLPEANWSVSWHRDTKIAVAERIEADGFTAWSVKDGLIHTQPPREVLAEMLTMRLHLDDCGPENGVLRVIPGSHLVDTWSESDAVDCSVKAGGVVMMKPLTIHSSKRSVNPTHRRVVHIEFAFRDLPQPLRWESKISTKAPVANGD